MHCYIMAKRSLVPQNTKLLLKLKPEWKKWISKNFCPWLCQRSARKSVLEKAAERTLCHTTNRVNKKSENVLGIISDVPAGLQVWFKDSTCMVCLEVVWLKLFCFSTGGHHYSCAQDITNWRPASLLCSVC